MRGVSGMHLLLPLSASENHIIEKENADEEKTFILRISKDALFLSASL